MKNFSCPSIQSDNNQVESSSANYAEVKLTMLASQNPKKRAGRKIFKETRHPVYRGVRRRDTNKWVCEAREPVSQKRVWLGSYPTAEMAARAHDVAVLAMRGRSACLNFADSVWRLPIPVSSNIVDIQKAAAQAAEAFRHTEDEVDVSTSETISIEEVVPVVELTIIEDVLSSSYIWDDQEEEMLFGMSGFIASMAEGLMLPPPETMTTMMTGSSAKAQVKPITHQALISH